MIQLHTDNLIAVDQIHSPNTHRGPPGRPYIRLLEPDTHTIFCYKENLALL